MKLSLTVIALAVVAIKGKDQKGKDRTIKQTCQAHFDSDSHSSTIDVESAENLSGSINIDNYSDNTNCVVNVVADPICSSITAKIVHAGFESDYGCKKNGFKFIDSNGVETDKMCGCVGGEKIPNGTYYNSIKYASTGKGCSDVIYPTGQDNWEEWFHTMYTYGHQNYPPSLAMKDADFHFPGNEFTLEITTDEWYANGNLRVEWSCEYADTTTTTTVAPECTYNKRVGNDGKSPASVLYETILSSLDTAITNDIKHNVSLVLIV